MNIALVIPQIVSYRIFLSGLARQAIERGWQVTVFTNTGGENINDAGIRLIHVPIPRGASFLGQLNAARILRRLWATHAPDLVHAHFSSAILCCALAGVRSMGAKSWATFQGLGYPLRGGLLGRILRLVEPLSARAFDRIEVLTGDDQQSLQALLPRRQVLRQPGFGFGCDDHFIDSPFPEPTQKAKLLETLAPGAQAPVFLYVGRLVQFKGFHVAIKAFQAFRERTQSGSLLVVGERDPLHPNGLTDEEWDALRSDPAIYLAGWQAAPLPWLDCANALLFFSQREGMPVSVMEAIARHLPVIGYDGRGTRELVKFSNTGLLTTSGDPSVLAQLMETGVTQVIPSDFSPPSGLRRSTWINYTLNTYADLVSGKTTPALNPLSV